MKKNILPEMPEVLDVIKTRRSVRKYLDMPVEWEKIANILEAGRYAPSSGNIQNFRFIVVTNKGTRESIANACLSQDWMSTAPLHIVILTDNTLSRQFYGKRGVDMYSIQNASSAAQNMLIAATAQGLGSCWVGAFEEEMIKDIIAYPRDVVCQAILTFGYTDEEPPVPPTYTLEHLTFLEGWGSRIRDGSIVMGYFRFGDRSKPYLEDASQKAAKGAKKIKDKLSDHFKKTMKKVKK